MMKHTSLQSVFLRAALVWAVFWAAAGQGADAADPLRDVLLRHTWTWKGPQIDTLVIFQANGQMVTRERQVSNWQVVDATTLRVTHPSRAATLLRFKDEFTRFEEVGVSVPTVVGVREKLRADVTAAPAAPPAGPGPVAPKPGETDTSRGGMTLISDWVPEKLETRRELLLSLEFYAKAVVGDAPRGKETVPTTLVGPFKWLMPLEEAVLALPKGAAKLSERRLSLTCFPDASLTVVAYTYKSFLDRNQTFNQLYFVVDLKRRLVAVQFVDQNPKAVSWELLPDGVREPYYNFISLTNNGSSSQEVPYKIFNAGPGVKLIKTALKKRGFEFYKENVHWYLAAPMAGCLLDIVDRNRFKGNLP